MDSQNLVFDVTDGFSKSRPAKTKMTRNPAEGCGEKKERNLRNIGDNPHANQLEQPTPICFRGAGENAKRSTVRPG